MPRIATVTAYSGLLNIRDGLKDVAVRIAVPIYGPAQQYSRFGPRYGDSQNRQRETTLKQHHPSNWAC